MPAELTTTLPPSGMLLDGPWESKRGLLYTTQGCWQRIETETDTYVVWLSHQGRGVAPPIAGGETSVQVDLPSDHVDDVGVATAYQATLQGLGFTVTRDGANCVTSGNGLVLGSTMGTTPLSGAGAAGIMGWMSEATVGNFPVGSHRMLLLSPSEIAALTSGRVAGYEVRFGAAHTGQVRAALYIGGASEDDPTGATLLCDLGQTVGDWEGWEAVPIPANVAQQVPNDGTRVWLAAKSDASGLTVGAGSITASTIAENSLFYRTPGTSQALRIYADAGATAADSSAGWPASVGTPASSNTFVLAIRLIYQDTPYYDDWSWDTLIGSRDVSTPLPDTTGMDTNGGVFVGNVFATPQVPGWRFVQNYVCYAAHDVANQYRLGVYNNVNPAALKDFTDETLLYDAGQTSGTAVGWNAIPVDEPGTPGELIRLVIVSDTGGSSLSFDAGPLESVWGWYGGPAGQPSTECETDGSETGFSFGAGDPLPAGPLTPNYDGVPVQPNNHPGAAVRIAIAPLMMSEEETAIIVEPGSIVVAANVAPPTVANVIHPVGIVAEANVPAPTLSATTVIALAESIAAVAVVGAVEVAASRVELAYPLTVAFVDPPTVGRGLGPRPDYEVKLGDTVAILRLRLSDANGPMDLSAAAAVRLRMRDRVTRPNRYVRDMTIAEGGVVEYEWPSESENAPPGDYDADVAVDFGGGEVAPFPSIGSLLFRLSPSV